MAKQIIDSAGIFIGRADLRCLSNRVAIEADAEVVDVSTFCSGKDREFLVGDRSIVVSAGGLIDWSDDDELYDMANATGEHFAVTSDVGDGATAYVGQIVTGNIRRELTRGTVAMFEFGAQLSSASFGRGKLLRYAKAATTSGSSTAVPLEAVGAAAKLFATLNVMGLSASASIDLTVQSDDNVNFTSPTNRAAFGVKNAVGGYGIAVDGPIADTYWRCVYTIAGSSPIVNFQASIGVR